MGEALVDAFRRATGDGRAVLLTGEGKGFNSGANLADAEALLEDPLRDIGTLVDRYYNPAIIAMKELEWPPRSDHHMLGPNT